MSFDGEGPALLEDVVQSQTLAKAFTLVGDVMDVSQVLFRDVAAAVERLIA